MLDGFFFVCLQSFRRARESVCGRAGQRDCYGHGRDHDHSGSAANGTKILFGTVLRPDGTRGFIAPKAKEGEKFSQGLT
jgi:hypothetical protein